MGLEQLSSPPNSVISMIDWFLDSGTGFHNPERPLRSLQALCSASDDRVYSDSSGRDFRLKRAKLSLVRGAIRKWMEFADRNPENIALLYFCGHGMAIGEGETSLLLENFGDDDLDPISGAIAFEDMRRGVKQHCVANTQIFLIDACRTKPPGAFASTYLQNGFGQTIVAGPGIVPTPNKVSSVFFASMLGSSAYGVPNDATVFTRGFLHSMRGPASRSKGQSWEVSVHTLTEGINDCIAWSMDDALQFCDSRESGKPFALHHLRQDPEALVKVYTARMEDLAVSTLAYRNIATGEVVRRDPLPSPWNISMASGRYTFEAQSPGIDPLEKTLDVVPPSREVVL